MLSQDLAIDLGNNNTLITDRHNLLLSQPSCLVINGDTDRVEAVGAAAYDMLEKVHHQLKPVKPLRGGVISDGTSAKRMLRELIVKVSKPGLFGRRFNCLLSGVPFDTTSVERRALLDALDLFPSRETHLIYEPLAAAMGMGLGIQSPEGKLVIDMGGGITEVVVIALSGIVTFQSTRVAGDYFDEVIRDYFRTRYNLVIGLRTAEQIKKNAGCVFAPLAHSGRKALAVGRDIREGIPMRRELDERELCGVLNRPFEVIEDAVQHTLETCPPELSSDIYENGMFVTGGGAMLRGVRERLEKRFEIPVHLDPHCLFSVSKGITRVLATPAKYRSVLF